MEEGGVITVHSDASNSLKIKKRKSEQCSFGRCKRIQWHLMQTRKRKQREDNKLPKAKKLKTISKKQQQAM